VTLLASAGNGKALWYATRGTGVVALLLLTSALVLGVLTSARWRTPKLPRFVVGTLHRNLSLLAIAFVATHVVTAVADHFAPIGFRDGVVPFASPYRPVWLGLGTVAFDLLLALVATSLLRARLGIRLWRAIHWLAYASWPVALLHSLGTGSDARFGWMSLVGIGSCLAAMLAIALRLARGAQPTGRRLAAAGARSPFHSRCLPGTRTARRTVGGPRAPARRSRSCADTRPPERARSAPHVRCRRCRSRAGSRGSSARTALI
jgi:methionine sulfoxide reductase heme-binding subunit